MNNTNFDNKQYELAYQDGMGNHYWHLARNRFIEKKLTGLSLENERVLDVGCGRGILIEYLRGRGVDCWGAERAKVRTVAAVEKYIFTYCDTSELDVEFRKSVKALLLLDVIEHLPDPSDLILQLSKQFQNAEYLIITTPARKELWSNYDLFYGHFRRYDLRMFAGLVKDTTFEIVDLRYFFHLLYPIMKIFFLFSKERSIRIVAPKGPAILLHKFLAKVFQLTDEYLPGKIVGASIFCCIKIRDKKDI
ncbi:MAG: class I SAM-dependent methyltransferase [Nitrospiraceae bacterium]|nr:class I SAM-dependent methyltransferase [Nitrospiraceae bacterium]